MDKPGCMAQLTACQQKYRQTAAVRSSNERLALRGNAALFFDDFAEPFDGDAAFDAFGDGTAVGVMLEGAFGGCALSLRYLNPVFHHYVGEQEFAVYFFDAMPSATTSSFSGAVEMPRPSSAPARVPVRQPPTAATT